MKDPEWRRIDTSGQCAVAGGQKRNEKSGRRKGDRDTGEREGDGETVIVWHLFQGAMTVRPEDVGRNRFFTHRMPVPEDGWIRTSERMPGPEDADALRCVLARHEIYGVRITGIVQFELDRRYTSWRRAPDPPDEISTNKWTT